MKLELLSKRVCDGLNVLWVRRNSWNFFWISNVFCAWSFCCALSFELQIPCFDSTLFCVVLMSLGSRVESMWWCSFSFLKCSQWKWFVVSRFRLLPIRLKIEVSLLSHDDSHVVKRGHPCNAVWRSVGESTFCTNCGSIIISAKRFSVPEPLELFWLSGLFLSICWGYILISAADIHFPCGLCVHCFWRLNCKKRWLQCWHWLELWCCFILELA